MRQQCAWCQKVLDGQGPILPGEEEDVSHGICKHCFSIQMNDLPVSKKDEIKCVHGVPGTEWCDGCESEV